MQLLQTALLLSTLMAVACQEQTNSVVNNDPSALCGYTKGTPISRVIASRGQGFGKKIQIHGTEEVDGIPRALVTDLHRGSYLINGKKLTLATQADDPENYRALVELAKDEGMPPSIIKRLKIAHQEGMAVMISPDSRFRKMIAAELDLEPLQMIFTNNWSKKFFRIDRSNDNWVLRYELQNMAIVNFDDPDTVKSLVNMKIDVRLGEVKSLENGSLEAAPYFASFDLVELKK